MECTTSNRPLHPTEGAHKHREYQAAVHLNNEAVSIISIGLNKDVKYQCTQMYRCFQLTYSLNYKNPNIALYLAVFQSSAMPEHVRITAKVQH